jgi:hypothetical protein
MNKLKRSIGPLASSLLLVGGLLLGSTASAKTNTVNVCHVPIETPSLTKLKPLKEGSAALADHLAHGDWRVTAPICEDTIVDNNCDRVADDPDLLNYDCVVLTGNADATCENQACIEPASTPIVRAFIDVDPADGNDYVPTVDIVIAELLDTDGNAGLTVGDTLQVNQYPKSFDPCPAATCNPADLGTFANQLHTVTAVSEVSPAGITVEFDQLCTQFYTYDPDTLIQVPCAAFFVSASLNTLEGFQVQGAVARIIPFDLVTPELIQIIDKTADSAALRRDSIAVEGSPGQLGTQGDFNIGTNNFADGPFIDLIFY